MWFTATEAAGVLLFKKKTEDGPQDGMSSTSRHNLNRDNCRPNLKWKTWIIKQNTHEQASKCVKDIDGFSDPKPGQTSELLLKDKKLDLF